ncbi:hypothetical protein [Roseomonas indoligenes]|uniref:Uncharacterized protein n=1 Tax=Roseomonas indoligenes TaxID=2820811 RepID=A0A940MQ35_9PROT|nr:hypothetical protein [Pararoseomonas indoligenes]MBP0491419.1 hypothetical protein [Pararoseomonas indoligenes]
MARSPAAAPRRAPSPTRAAFTRLSTVLQRGASPDRMTREVDGVVDDLRASGEPEDVRNWLEELRDGFAEAAEAAAEAVDEVDSSEKAARRHAENAAQAMVAIRDAFARHLEAPA